LDATSTPDAGVVADGSSRTDTDAGAGAGESGAPGTTGDLTREVPGFANRAYLLHPPGGVVPTKPAPVVIVFHGGGGNADGVVRMTCPGGDLASDACIDRLADREGFLLVIPNGTGTLLAPNTRTWNAGGGTANWQCVSGQACMRGIDDVAYFDALMADLATVATIDSRRVFLTGISNGAAMSHRLACERADAVAAIAPVAGGNQLTTGAPCTPSRPVSVLAIHGTADPCWAFDGGPGACLQTDNKDKIGIPRTMEEWAARDGCDATPTTTPLPDVAPDDGVTTTVEDYAGCAGDTAVRLMKIDGGGHTWPNGFQYLAPATIGITTRDFSANEAMWEFLAEHPIP
jgi:polyhydroxybutyrate depolymerase